MKREPVEIEKRSVSKARRERIIKAQDGACKRACCEQPATDVDHIIPLWAGGSNRDENLEGLCGDCHARKTKAEASARAKVKRIVNRAEGRMKPKRPISGAGFQKHLTKGFDGKVRARKAVRK